MAIELRRPASITTQLGPALRATPTPRRASWPLGRLAVRALLGGIGLGLLVGVVRAPTAATVLLFGAMALGYLVVSFALERPASHAWSEDAPPD